MRVQLMVLLLLAMACAANQTPAPNGITAPVLVHKVLPEYPPEYRRDEIEGVVKVQGMIDKTGQMVNPTVLQSSDPRLNELALAAVAQWRWRPGTMNGEPVGVLFMVDVKFRAR